MDNLKNNIYDRVIVNNDREFIENDKLDVSVNYIILCENDDNNEFHKPIYQCSVLGLPFYDWVSMACSNKPACLYIEKGEKFINLIKPYMGDSEYTVVLYADTPLISKSHLIDLIGYVTRKRLNVCKLKRGYILKNEYIFEVDEIYSSLVYDLASNDLFKVETISDYDNVKDILEKKLFNYYKRNGVTFCNQNSTNISANIFIGNGTIIYGGVSIINKSYVGDNVTLEPNSVIDNSKIEDNVEIGAGSIILNSVIKTGSVIKAGSVIFGSVINENSKLGLSCKITKTAVGENSVLDDFVTIKNANVLKGTKVGDYSAIVGDNVVVSTIENAEINVGSKIIKKGND